MNRPDELLKIGAFAELAGTNLRTLRYYEEIGLLEPALRSRGRFRYYRPTDLNRVRMIRNLQDLGLAYYKSGTAHSICVRFCRFRHKTGEWLQTDSE